MRTTPACLCTPPLFSLGLSLFPLQTRGQLDEVVIDTLLDLCDKNGDGEINADEFADEVLAGANSYFFADMADSFDDGGAV